MIDLRSDTVTKPTPEMLEYMLQANVGDDVYGEDPTVNELQDYTAELFSKEAALFVPSGVMGNQLGIKVNTNQGDEVICESQAHIFYYETAAPSIISNVQLRTLDSENGEIDLNKVESAIRTSEYYLPKTSLICLENTHNRHSGTVLNLDYISKVSELARTKNISTHLDGARIWNAISYSNYSFDTYSKYFDTISICLSKGLGAPIGSVLVGSYEKIEMAKKWRKILGGGMRQLGIMAAGGLYAIKNHFKLLSNDHINAKNFADKIARNELFDINLEKVQTNIVLFNLNQGININEFIRLCKLKGLLISSMGGQSIRAVFHFQVNENDMRIAYEVINDTAKQLFEGRI